jgi:uncharacterized membrane protein YebE (DUF533 family)
MFGAKKLLNVLAVSSALEKARHVTEAAAAAVASAALELGKEVATGAANLTGAAVSTTLEKGRHGLQVTGTAVASTASDALELGKAVATGAANQSAAVVSTTFGKARDGLQSPEARAYLSKAKDFVGQNQETIGVLGELVSILPGGGLPKLAAKLIASQRAINLINTLAHTAFPNHQEGVPGLEQLTAAPRGSGFSEEAHTHESALLLVRAMVATAASDEVVDPSQWVKIVGEMNDGGLDAQTAEFLDAEIQHPATIDEIARSVGSSKELALLVYAAAHLVATSEPEKRFLKDLAEALTLAPSDIAKFNQIALMHTAPAH